MFNKEDLNRLYRYSLSLCHKEEDAYDILNESLEKVLSKDSITEVQFPMRYMMRVIKNTFLNSLRKNKFEILVACPVDELKEPDLNGEEFSRLDVEKILAFCSDAEREILYLWSFEGMTYSEISAHLEISRGSLLSKVHVLKKRIQQHFNIGGGNE